MTTERWRVRFMPADFEIECSSNVTILEAARQVGVKMRSACRNGICDVCVAEHRHGDLAFISERASAVLDNNKRVLCCHALPLSDVEIYMSSVQNPEHKPSQTLAFQVQSVSELPGHVFRVVLRAPAGKPLDFWPGQYLLLHIPNEQGEIQQLPYSIASAPGSWTGDNVRDLELHIANASDTSRNVIAQLQREPTITVTLPMGDCFVTEQQLKATMPDTVVLIASGTGFAQIKSLAEGILAVRPEQEVHIYWSNREADGFYLKDLPTQWAHDFEHLHYHPIIEQDSEGWSGRAGWIYQVIAHDFQDLSDCLVYACGSPDMVYGTLDQLAPIGLTDANMKSDVFAYAPRS